MSQATIASLVRTAARGESDFVSVAQSLLDEGDPQRLAEFFDKMNTPRSVGGEGLLESVPGLTVPGGTVTDFEAERAVADGIQKYLDRHERKIKWHATHPSIEGTQNVLLVMRASMYITQLRLDRLVALLSAKDDLTPVEWAYAREMMNRAFLSFRNYLNLFAGAWVDSMLANTPREEFLAAIGNFYEHVDHRVRALEEYRQRLETRRFELAVTSEGFPPVKPPNYFGGDLLKEGPWNQYWSVVDSRTHHFREVIG